MSSKSPRLTTEFAASVHLPLNPLKRIRIVGEMLDDPSMVGRGVNVLLNPPKELVAPEDSIILERERPHLALWLDARGILKEVAATLEERTRERDRELQIRGAAGMELAEYVLGERPSLN